VISGKAATVLLVALRYLGARRFATWISMAAIALSLVMVVGVSLISFAMQKAAVQGAIRYPLIVGPDSASSVQLIFSTVFHIDKPTGTIPVAVYEQLRTDRRVTAAYPVAVADSLGNYPIVGTTEAFLRDLRSGMAAGHIDLSKPEYAVLGAEAAARNSLSVGDHFHGSHGMVGTEHAEHHAELTYRVVGILAPTLGPADAAAYTSFQTVWRVHQDEGADGGKYHLADGQLTAVLVRTANPAFAAQLEAELSLRPGTQGVDTGRAIRRLISYLSKGERIVEAFSAVALAIAIALILVTLVMSLNERRKELALMRSLGIGRLTISLVIMVEALAITVGGTIGGIVLGHVAVWWAEHPIRESLGITVQPWRWTSMESLAVVATLAAGQLLAVASLLWTYRMNLVEEVARD